MYHSKSSECYGHQSQAEIAIHFQGILFCLLLHCLLTGRSSPGLVKLGTNLKEEVPVKKIRRVLPEHEGKYKITMPKGTTEKTRKILQEKGMLGKCGKAWYMCWYFCVELQSLCWYYSNLSLSLSVKSNVAVCIGCMGGCMHEFVT